MSFSGSTIFVTGGAGFIGSAVSRHLLDETDAFVVNIDKLTYASSLASVPQATPALSISPQGASPCRICVSAEVGTPLRKMPA